MSDAPEAASLKGMTARQALAEAIGGEIKIDLDQDVMAAIDRILAALWILGFKVVKMDE
jgi:hypothetical protein